MVSSSCPRSCMLEGEKRLLVCVASKLSGTIATECARSILSIVKSFVALEGGRPKGT